MILLRHDCLVFKTSDGDFPFAAEQVTIEIMGEAVQLLDEEVIKNASEAVLHYFKAELGKSNNTWARHSIAAARIAATFRVYLQRGSKHHLGGSNGKSHRRAMAVTRERRDLGA